MIQPRSDARVSPEQSQADGAVADVPQVGTTLSGFIRHSRSDLFHAKNALIEVRHLFVTLGIDRHMSNSSEHELIPLSSPTSPWRELSASLRSCHIGFSRIACQRFR